MQIPLFASLSLATYVAVQASHALTDYTYIKTLYAIGELKALLNVSVYMFLI